MKKIGIIVQMLSGGGAERCAANMSIDLSATNDVHLIVFDCRNKTYRYGGTLHDLNLPASNNYIRRIMIMVARIIKVRQIKKKEKFDVVISLLEGANIVNVLSKQNEKTIVSERNLISFFIKSKLHIALERLILRRADKVVALSNVVKEDLINSFSVESGKIVTIYNSVDVKKFERVKSTVSENKRSDGPQIVTMGRLTHQKAQWHILRAFRYVLNQFPTASLIVLGQGELYEDYLDYSKFLNIMDHVEFKGFVPEPHQIIMNSDMFVFSSMVEGLGNVILEALACGKAVISTDCDAGPREILAPSTDINKKTKEIEYAEYGILVPVTENDHFDKSVITLSPEEQCIADAIIELIMNRELREKYERLSLIRANDFSPEKITEDWIELLDSVIE